MANSVSVRGSVDVIANFPVSLSLSSTTATKKQAGERDGASKHPSAIHPPSVPYRQQTDRQRERESNCLASEASNKHCVASRTRRLPRR